MSAKPRTPVRTRTKKATTPTKKKQVPQPDEPVVGAKVIHTVFGPSQPDNGKGKEEESAPPVALGNDASLSSEIDSLHSLLKELAKADGKVVEGRKVVIGDTLGDRTRFLRRSGVEDGVKALQDEVSRLLSLSHWSPEDVERTRRDVSRRVSEVLLGMADLLKTQFSSQAQLEQLSLEQLRLDDVLKSERDAVARLEADVMEATQRVAEKKAAIASVQKRRMEMLDEKQKIEEGGKKLDLELAKTQTVELDDAEEEVVAHGEGESVVVVVEEEDKKKKKEEVREKPELVEAIRALEEERDVLRRQVDNLRRLDQTSKRVVNLREWQDETKHQEQMKHLRAELESSRNSLNQMAPLQSRVSQLEDDREKLAQALEAAKVEKATQREQIMKLTRALREMSSAHRALKTELEEERHRSMSFDEDAQRQRVNMTSILDDMLSSLEMEKAHLRKALRSSEN